MSNDVTRRDAFKVLATGAAGAVIGAGSNAIAAGVQRPAFAGADSSTPAVSEATFATAGRMAGELVIPESNPASLATVLHCRSWSREVYLHISEQVRGFVTLSLEGHAMAAAFQAAGRPIAVRWWGHNPQFDGGAGRFEGAIVAADVRDLPGESVSTIA